MIAITKAELRAKCDDERDDVNDDATVADDNNVITKYWHTRGNYTIQCMYSKHCLQLPTVNIYKSCRLLPNLHLIKIRTLHEI